MVQAFTLILSAVVLLAAPLRGAEPARVTGVVVQFDNGTQQKLDAPVTPPAPAVTQPATQSSADWPRPILGVNIETNRDYERQFMFIDVMKTSRRWGSTTQPYNEKGPTGPDGWPSGDAGTCALTEVKNCNGVYKFSCTGRCDLTTPASAAFVSNLIYDSARNRTTADVTLKAPPDKPTTLNLVWRGTDGGIKDIKLLRPHYLSDEQIFTSEFLNALRPFDAIRFMDYLRTNNSTVSKWDERCKITDAQYITRGGPYEYAIELGNRMDKDIWLNIPALADDDFITQLGQLVRAKLKPSLHCYVEYSNEVWNGQFKQFRQNFDAAKAQVAAGDKTLNDGGADTNDNYWARKRIAQRAVQIKKLMAPPGDPQIRVVLASQVGYMPPGALLKMQLEYVEKYFGPPSQFFYAVAGAPYFSPGKDETDPTGKTWYTQRKDQTVDSLITRLQARTGSSANEQAKAFHALAHKYGLKSFAYEGGLDMQQFQNGYEAKVASQNDVRMGRVVEDYLNNWYAGGGDGLFYFTLSCKYSKSGYWGLTEDVRELLTPKYLAAVRVSTKLRSGPGH
jgi:hypothetical protein